MGMVQTGAGLLPRAELEVKDIVEEGPNHRSIATEWYYKGELVRRDAHVMVLQGQSLGGQQTTIG